MPIAKVQIPDGRVVRLEVPEGATNEQIIEFARNNVPQAATPEQQEMVDVPSRLARGAMDPITGLAQMLYESVPQSVQDVGTSVDQALFEATGGVLGAQKPFSEAVTQQEQEYQQARQATGQEGIDLARLGGNIATTLPLAFAAPASATATLPARIGTGMLTGAGYGAAQPVYEGDFLTEKAKQAGAGAASGGLLAPVAGGIARVVRPQTSQSVQTMMREGITPTPGQALGGAFQRTEEKLQSLPILGDAITMAKTRGIADMNRAAYNRALAPLGKRADKSFPVGREGIAKVEKTLSDAYDDILPKVRFQADSQFATDLQKLRSMVQTLPEQEIKQFDRILNTKLYNKMTPANTMSGESLKKAESELGEVVRKYIGSQSGDQRDLAKAVIEVQRSLRDALARQNPAQADRLKAINSGWANYNILRKAGTYQGAESGFSPAQLANASKWADKSVGKGRTAKGQALMQDFTDPAKDVLTSRVANSGTTDRLLLSGAALGSGKIVPAIPAGLIAGSIPYLPGARQATAALLTQRPESFGLLADAIRRSSVAGGALGPALLND